MSEHRRYLTIIQDPRGYPAKGGADPAPPEGPTQPVLHRVVLEGDYDELRAERDELREALEKIVTVADRCGGYRWAAGMGIMETIARQVLGATGEGSVSDGD